MASEAKKPSRSERMYGKSPKITEAKDEKPESKAEEKAEPESKQSPAEEAAEGDGGGGIPLSDVHVRESKAMHTRHQQEYSALVRRHAKERDAPSGIDASTPGADAGDAGGGAGAAAA